MCDIFTIHFIIVKVAMRVLTPVLLPPLFFDLSLKYRFKEKRNFFLVVVVYTIIKAKKQTIEKTVGGRTYVCKRKPYYNCRIKNASYRYKYVEKKENSEIRRIRSVLLGRSLIHGPFIPLPNVVSALGLEDLLAKHPTGEEVKRILAMAISRIVVSLPLSS